MKRITALILTLLLVFSSVLTVLPIGVFADSAAVEITETQDSYTGAIGYSGYIVRAKSDGSIMLSPFLSQLRSDVNAGANIADYTAEMTFTLLKGDGGAAVYTFETVHAAINKSNGQYFDIYLNGSKGTTGFCPIAGEFYDIEFNVYKNYGEASQALVYYGTYKSAEIPSGISSSKYYVPSEAPVSAPQISETKDGYTGSIGYSGGIRVKSDKSIMFSPYITELKELQSQGENVADYTAELTFMLLSEKDGEVVHTFDTVSASLTRSNQYYDIYLNGSKGNSGFCPTAGEYYNIGVEIYKNYGTESETLAMYGTYKNVFAPEGLADSGYYVPTPQVIEITETKDTHTGDKGYKGGIRLKSDSSVMFSPYNTELMALVDKGENMADYTAEITFALLSGEGGEVVHTFDMFTASPIRSNHYFDIYLNGSKTNSGFCPTAGEYYNVTVNIYKHYGKATSKLVMGGTYKSLKAPDDLSTSKYYVPTAVPGAPVDYEISVSYSFNNALAGSAAGKIFVTVDKPGYFAIGWGDGEGEPLTVTTGEKTLKYSPLNSFVLTDSNGGSHVEKVITFTAIPVGAETVIITDSVGNVLEALELPENKLLEETEPEYTFGVVSDVHFNYFFNSDKTVDYAEGAFDTALALYKAAGVDLVAAAGDYSLYGEEESYREFYEAVAKSGLLVIACGGNHELYASLETMFGENGYWRTYMNDGIYDGSVEGVLDIADNGIDFTYQIPGVEDSVFVSLSQWYWDGHTASQKKLVEPEQLVWLEEQFELHKDKKVYFLFHTYLSDDDGENIDGQGDLKSPGGYSYNGHYNTYTSDEKVLRQLLTKYDNVIWYNGHSHYEFSMQMFNENLNIFDYQGTTATMVHVPSVTNPRTVGVNSSSYSSLYGQVSQGVLQFAYDGYDIVNGLDIIGEEILSYACYIVYSDKADVVEGGEIEGTDITWTYDAQLNSLRILGEGAIPAYTDATAPWAEYADQVYSLYVGSGIYSIGAEAFGMLQKLDRVELKGVEFIGKKAFAGTPITTLILPETLSSIENGAFEGVTTITSIIYGGTAENWAYLSLGDNGSALGAEKTFKKVRVTFIAGDKKVVQDVKVGDVPKFNGIPTKTHEDETKHYLFTGWTDGTNKYPANGDFAKATANVTYTALFETVVERLITGSFGEGLTWTFDRKTATLTISGKGAMPDYATSDVQPWAAYGAEIENVVVKRGITSVGKNAFSRIASLRTVTVEEGIENISMDAFAYCEKLETITLPSTIKTIGQGAVYSSNNIKTVNYGGTSIAQLKAANGGSFYNGLRDDEVSGGFANVTTWNFSFKQPIYGFTDDEDGTRYYYEDGSFAKGWKEIDGKTYYFAADGLLFEGDYVESGAQTIWFGSDHAVLEGLVLDADGYRFYIGGVRQYAWQDTDGDGEKDAYFFSTSFLRCEEDRLLFDGIDTRRFYKYNEETGHMEIVNGFYTDEDGTRFFTNGIGRYGWITPEGEIITDRPGVEVYGAYYFTYGDGTVHYRVDGTSATIGGVTREFGEDHLVKAYTGWSQSRVTGNPNYYVDGVMQQGWCLTPEGWVYLSKSEKLDENLSYGDAFYEWRKIGGKVYYFRASTSQGAYTLITAPIRALNYNGIREQYIINQPADPSAATGADYYITNPPAGF